MTAIEETRAGLKSARSGPAAGAMVRVVMTLGCLMLLNLPERVGAETIVYLVRHAETVSDGSADPGLNPEGRARAGNLADHFADLGIERVFSTEFKRTTETARVTARRLGLDIERYDGRALETFAETLKGLDAVVLVSGHSNTTPALVNRLVGEERFQPLQHYQYDFIFRVHLTDDGGSRVTIDHSLPRSVYGDHPKER